MENKLTKARKIINEIDKKMAELFVQRMQAVKAASEYKRRNGLPILDAQREEEVVEKNAAFIDSEELRPFYVEFLKDTMKASRHYQEQCLKEMRVTQSDKEDSFKPLTDLH